MQDQTEFADVTGPEQSLSRALRPNYHREAEAATQSASVYENLPQVPQELEQDLAAGRTAAAIRQEVTAMQFEATKMIGQVQTLEMFQNFAGTGRLLLLKQMKESKAYKGMVVPSPQGGTRIINTFDEFCDLLNISKSTVYEDIQNLNTFGESFMESAQKIGLGYRDLRKLRQLPEEDRQLVIEGEKVSNDPEALKDLLEDMVSRNSAKKRELEQERDKLKRDKNAMEKVLQDKNAALDAAQTRLANLETITPDEQRQLQSERETKALEEFQREGFVWLGQCAKLLSHLTGILNEPGISRHCLDTAQEQLSVLCCHFAEDLIAAGARVDFRYQVYPLELGEIAERGDNTLASLDPEVQAYLDAPHNHNGGSNGAEEE